jgi:H+/Cl- antiporter ClcA
MSVTDRRYYGLLWHSAILGLLVGLACAAFTLSWKALDHFVWHSLHAPWHRIWFSLAVGIVIGVILKIVGDPGSMATIIAHFHRTGALPMRDNLPIQPASVLGLVAGQSAGPEGALTQAGGSLGAWLARRLQLRAWQRVLTLAGMGAGFGAFLGAPVGGAILWLEMLHSRGLEYFEAVIPTLVCSFVAYVMMLICVGHGVVQPWHLAAAPVSGTWTPLVAFGLGLFCALVARSYAFIFRAVGMMRHRLGLPLIIETSLAGLAIGLLGVAAPLSYFYGGTQIPVVMTMDTTLLALGGLLAAKMLAASITIRGHWQGGLIIPHMFIGAVLARMIIVVLPGLPPVLTLLCCMAAFNAAVTQTPLASALIVLALTGAGTPIPVFLASITAFIAGHGIIVVENKRSRTEPMNFHLEPIDPIPRIDGTRIPDVPAHLTCAAAASPATDLRSSCQSTRSDM